MLLFDVFTRMSSVLHVLVIVIGNNVFALTTAILPANVGTKGQRQHTTANDGVPFMTVSRSRIHVFPTSVFRCWQTITSTKSIRHWFDIESQTSAVTISNICRRSIDICQCWKGVVQPSNDACPSRGAVHADCFSVASYDGRRRLLLLSLSHFYIAKYIYFLWLSNNNSAWF